MRSLHFGRHIRAVVPPQPTNGVCGLEHHLPVFCQLLSLCRPAYDAYFLGLVGHDSFMCVCVFFIYFYCLGCLIFNYCLRLWFFKLEGFVVYL